MLIDFLFPGLVEHSRHTALALGIIDTQGFHEAVYSIADTALMFGFVSGFVAWPFYRWLRAWLAPARSEEVAEG